MIHKSFFQQYTPTTKYQVVEDDEKFQLSLDVPGVKLSDIQVNLNKKEDGYDVLSISGSRSIVDTEKGSKHSSTFAKSFYLDPTVEGEKITANLQNGVLVVSAPKHITKKIEESVKSIPITEIAQDENQEELPDGNKDLTDDDATEIKVSNKDAEMEKGDVGEDNIIDLDEQKTED